MRVPITWGAFRALFDCIPAPRVGGTSDRSLDRRLPPATYKLPDQRQPPPSTPASRTSRTRTKQWLPYQTVDTSSKRFLSVCQSLLAHIRCAVVECRLLLFVRFPHSGTDDGLRRIADDRSRDDSSERGLSRQNAGALHRPIHAVQDARPKHSKLYRTGSFEFIFDEANLTHACSSSPHMS